ncbi:hypothetical protein DO97_01370 [Neosynechococcus sphagnicola sy1]|uniref:DUF3854 domain-containing protein n=1 Tax=Neosynechococcus sphagnicola sy1 TaxID=1497020 RepID=A0A098TLK5_9CYAN|nr:hypothetical protein [Neosynechococcus sphagnicola]KGF73195.1 hypothetical protein DO97_01370 [Neosynechococcus sphagnicola sy1]
MSDGQRPHSEHRQKFTPSSKRNPCPVCNRTKDSDCRISENGNFVLCHSKINGRQPKENLNGFIWLGTDPTQNWGKWIAKSEDWQKERPVGQEFRYPFCDRQGKVLVEEVRVYQSGGGKKQWMEPKGVDTARLLPYRYSEAVDALKAGAEHCFIVEGPPKADVLWSLGLPAVAFANGFKPSRDSQWFEGFENRLVIVPDRDRPGIQKAERILQAYPMAGLFKPWSDSIWWEPDWLPAGGGLDVKDWCTEMQLQGLSDDQVRDLILSAVESGQPPPPRPEESPKSGNQSPLEEENKKAVERKSAFDLLMAIATGPECDYWHDTANQPYVDLTIEGIRHTYPLRKKQFKTWLGRELYRLHEKSPNSEALQSCLGVLEAQATFDSTERQTWLRTGEFGGNIYIDLSDATWRVLEVTPAGWQLIESANCPVRFIRNDGQLPLPEPTTIRGGKIGDLGELICVDTQTWPLLVGFAAYSLMPTGSKPILTLSSPKGSGKSTAAKILKRLIDPGKAPLLPLVGDRRSTAVAANNRWLMAYDNLTSLSTEQQDTLCCASTGAGFSHRTLHSDLDETWVEYTRPQILTAVDLVPSRSDLLDRCILVSLNAIEEGDRLSDEQLEAKLQTLAPSILGGLLDALSMALRRLPEIKPERLPRMASFAKFCIAAEPALGLQPGAFLRAYTGNIQAAQEAAVEANPLAAAILAVLESSNPWQGSASALLTAIKEQATETKVQKLTARTLGRALSGSIKSDLAAVGVEIDQYRRSDRSRERVWTIERLSSPPDRPRPDKHPKIMSETSETSDETPELPFCKGSSFGHQVGHHGHETSEKRFDVRQTSEKETHAGKGFQPTSDIADIMDIKNSTLSDDSPSQINLNPQEVVDASDF